MRAPSLFLVYQSIANQLIWANFPFYSRKPSLWIFNPISFRAHFFFSKWKFNLIASPILKKRAKNATDIISDGDESWFGDCHLFFFFLQIIQIIADGDDVLFSFICATQAVPTPPLPSLSGSPWSRYWEGNERQNWTFALPFFFFFFPVL